MNNRGQIAIFLFILICTLTSLLLWGRLKRKENMWSVPGQGCPLYLHKEKVMEVCSRYNKGRSCTPSELNLFACKYIEGCKTMCPIGHNNFTSGAIRSVPRTDNGFADAGSAVSPFLDYLYG